MHTRARALLVAGILTAATAAAVTIYEWADATLNPGIWFEVWDQSVGVPNERRVNIQTLAAYVMTNNAAAKVSSLTSTGNVTLSSPGGTLTAQYIHGQLRGSDIEEGTVYDAFIDPAIARDSEVDAKITAATNWPGAIVTNLTLLTPLASTNGGTGRSNITAGQSLIGNGTGTPDLLAYGSGFSISGSPGDGTRTVTVTGGGGGGGDSATADTTSAAAATIFTNSPATNTTFRLSATVIAAGPTNHASYTLTTTGYRLSSAPVLHSDADEFLEQLGPNRSHNAAEALIGTNALWVASGNDVILRVWGIANGSENAHWLASDIQAFSTTNHAAAPSGPTYLVNQNFEGTGYDNSETWTEIGTVDADESVIVGDGSQSIQLDGSVADSYITSPAISGSELWGYLKFYPDHIPTADAIVLRVMNGETMLGQIVQRSTGVLRVTANGGSGVACGLSIGEDSWVHIWWRYKQGSGTNSEMEVRWATTDTDPGTSDSNYRAISAAGTYTQAPIALRLHADNVGTSNGSTYFDKVRVDNESITSAPE